ncbi:isopentenyl-diphosphate Delta-isomerase [Primorskyibacter sp. 2E233]|uniref:isopentenyl-diphosphate Delta-isomerase n=1 Tax=Primorskyibacter sp. 2E233 TaxID=3413431 RepID=UPI003BEF6D8A
MHTKIPAWINGTLVPVDKLEAHLRGLRHKAVSVFVLLQGQVLIQRRAMGKYHTPGLWANTCCTHPHWEEDPLICAQRRLEQELGITGLSPQFREQVEYRADVGGGMIEHEVVDIFVAEATAEMPLVPNPEEVMETAWLDLTALRAEVDKRPQDFTPWLKIYLNDHAKRIFG